MVAGLLGRPLAALCAIWPDHAHRGAARRMPRRRRSRRRRRRLSAA